MLFDSASTACLELPQTSLPSARDEALLCESDSGLITDLFVPSC